MTSKNRVTKFKTKHHDEDYEHVVDKKKRNDRRESRNKKRGV